MNRHITSLIALGACMFGANAAQLTPEEALNRLESESGIVRKISATGKPRLAYTAATGSVNQFYVFNNSGNNGFTVVSADDCITPLLGYSDESEFDPDNMPDNMKAWLDSYQQQIEWAIANNISSNDIIKAKREEITPLVKTKWNQTAPYNNLCPVYNGSKCASGCVATAMAQIMKYHEWPVKGKGTHSYLCTNSTIGMNFGTLSMNFGNTTFDWDNMTDRYNSSSTQAEEDAVATLMYACGISVDMAYGPSSGASSSKPVTSFVKYFDYDAGTTYYLRDYFSGSAWEEMIYNELAAKRPVMYDGVTGKMEGHEFVCDGYRDGYFHINWGWGGLSDGYFLLSALDPGIQGTGGGSSGFNFTQGATIGIQKPVAGSKSRGTLISTKNFYTDNSTYKRSDIFQMRTAEYAYYPIEGTIDVRLGMKLTDSEGKVRYVFSPTEATEMKGMYTILTSFPMRGDNFPQSGTYTAKPACYNTATETWNDILIPINYSQGFTLTIEGDRLTFEQLTYDPQLKISDIKLLTPLYSGKNFHVTATATVTNNEFYGNIRAALRKKGSTSIAARSSMLQIDVEPGQQLEIDMVSELSGSAPAGDYDFVFIDAGNKAVSDPIEVKFMGKPNSTTSIEIVSFAPESNSMPQNQIKLNGTVKCTSGYLDEPLSIYLFEPGNDYSVTNWATKTMWLAEGESADFSIEGEYLDGKTGLGYYTAVVYYDNNMLKPYATFRLKKATSGIDNVSTEKAAVTPNPADNYVTVTAECIEKVDIYSITGIHAMSIEGNGDESLGIDISGLAAGNYVITVTGADGMTTLRLIKR